MSVASTKNDTLGRIVLITDYGCYPADEEYVRHALSMKRTKHGAADSRYKKDILVLLMFGDFMDCLAHDEWVEEGIETMKYWPQRWGMNG